MKQTTKLVVGAREDPQLLFTCFFHQNQLDLLKNRARAVAGGRIKK